MKSGIDISGTFQNTTISGMSDRLRMNNSCDVCDDGNNVNVMTEVFLVTTLFLYKTGL
jgi:hypothetical protein